MPPHWFFADPEIDARHGRFLRFFQAHEKLGELTDTLLNEEGAKIRNRHRDDHLVETIASASLGRGMKDLQAIQRLCLLGFGEQAMILLRSSVNVLINLNYILSDVSPRDRADEFMAFSFTTHAAFMRENFHQEPSWQPDMSPEELKRKSGAWEKVGIRRRAERLEEHHYNVGYRFYSSVEHADVASLADQMTEVPGGTRVDSGPSDAKVALILGHSYMVFVDLLSIICRYYRIERPQVFEELGRRCPELSA